MKIAKPQMRKARIEIIPMIDAIFFLLVFFMMSSLSMVKMKGMGVSLPRNATAESRPPPRLIVSVYKDGDWYLGLQKIEPSTLQGLLQSRVTADPESVVVVNVDKQQSVQTLVNVMDAVNSVKKPDGDAAAVMISTSFVDPKTGNAVTGGAGT